MVEVCLTPLSSHFPHLQRGLWDGFQGRPETEGQGFHFLVLFLLFTSTELCALSRKKNRNKGLNELVTKWF